MPHDTPLCTPLQGPLGTPMPPLQHHMGPVYTPPLSALSHAPTCTGSEGDNLDHKVLLPTHPLPSSCYVNCKVPEGRGLFKKRPDKVTPTSWLTHRSDGGPSVALQNKSPP